MPNVFRGESEIELSGKTYVIRLDFNAVAKVQSETGLSLVSRDEAISKPFVFVRAALAAGLSREGKTVSLDEAGDLISNNISKLPKIMEATMSALNGFLLGPDGKAPSQQAISGTKKKRIKKK